MERATRQAYGRSNSRYKKTWREKIINYFRSFVAFMFTNVGIVGLVVGYTVAGAFMFQAIEETEWDNKDRALSSSMETTRNALAKELWNLTYHSNVFNEKMWRDQVTITITAYQKKIVLTALAGYDPSRTISWTFPGAFLYSLTVITTIGYGNLAPCTKVGKLATVIYAIMGMPLFLLYLSNIGDILAKSFKWIYFKMCLCRGCPGSRTFRRRRFEKESIKMRKIPVPTVQQQQDEFLTHQEWQISHAEANQQNQDSPEENETVNEDSDDEKSAVHDESSSSADEVQEEYDPQSVTVPITLCLAIMVGYVCGGALLFRLWEKWGFLDGSYFCFISLSTIGFGDILPGDEIFKNDEDKQLSISFIATAVYLMLGMALIAMCFNLMQEEVVHKTRACIKICKNIFSCRRAYASFE